MVRGLVWRSHPDQARFSEQENLRFADGINEAGGQVFVDERVRRGGSHHQKLFVIRHRSDGDSDVAFVGGMISHTAVTTTRCTTAIRRRSLSTGATVRRPRGMTYKWRYADRRSATSSTRPANAGRIPCPSHEGPGVAGWPAPPVSPRARRRFLRRHRTPLRSAHTQFRCCAPIPPSVRSTPLRRAANGASPGHT